MLFTLLAVASAQDLELPIASPAASVTQQIGTATVTVDYFSPGVKGRKVFGELVPYGEMWRTGANGGTTITSDADLKVGGKDVPAGTYMLFTIPNDGKWTVVLNKDLNARPWSHEESLDLARFDVEPKTIPARERLTFVFSDTDHDSASLDLEWADVRVSLPIEVDTVGRAVDAIDAYSNRAARRLADGARFHLEHGDVGEGLKLVDQSIGVKETWFALFTRAELLKKKGDAKGAYKAAQAAMKAGKGTEGFFWEDRVKQALDSWPKK